MSDTATLYQNLEKVPGLADLEALASLEQLARLSSGVFPAFSPTLGLERARPDGVRAGHEHMAGAMYRTLVEELPVVSFMAALGQDRGEIYVSPYIESLLGFSQREWLENPILWYDRL